MTQGCDHALLHCMDDIVLVSGLEHSDLHGLPVGGALIVAVQKGGSVCWDSMVLRPRGRKLVRLRIVVLVVPVCLGPGQCDAEWHGLFVTNCEESRWAYTQCSSDKVPQRVVIPPCRRGVRPALQVAEATHDTLGVCDRMRLAPSPI